MATQPPISIRTAVLHGNDRGLEYWAQVTEDEMFLKDLLSNNATAARHGFLPKLSGNASDILNGLGQWISSGPGSGTFTATGTGFTVNPTVTATWLRIGPLTILYIPILTGTSNATTFTITGLPPVIVPVVDSEHIQGATDNGVGGICHVFLAPASSVIGLGFGVGNVPWTAAGAKASSNMVLVY